MVAHDVGVMSSTINIIIHKGDKNMKKDVREANVVMAKCKSSKRPFGIRIEKRMDNVWYYTWAFKLSEQAGNTEGYENVMISGRVDMDTEYPGCPYCGGIGWISCGNCGKLTCYNGESNHFTCAWCGNSGEVQFGETFDLSGGGY